MKEKMQADVQIDSQVHDFLSNVARLGVELELHTGVTLHRVTFDRGESNLPGDFQADLEAEYPEDQETKEAKKELLQLITEADAENLENQRRFLRQEPLVNTAYLNLVNKVTQLIKGE